jgi:inositol oxygenase
MSATTQTSETNAPLASLDEWEDFLQQRYPETGGETAVPSVKANADQHEYRDYRAEARASVKEFYRLNHRYQTFDFVQAKRAEYLPLNHRTMGIWEAMEYLNTLVDDSDPDTDLTQIEHLLQTAEAIRADGHPRWFILTGLIHDLGKILCLWGEPQWAVVGDTFPVGCRFSEKIVFPEFFADNPDSATPKYQTENGIYEPGAGLDKVFLSWGHDEYLYHVTKDYLPDEALYMIRYHSFYPAHTEGAYGHLMNAEDRRLFDAVRAFNPYDLYSKTPVRPDVKELRPYYEDLIAEYFPPTLRW